MACSKPWGNIPMLRWWRLRWINLHTYFNLLNSLWASQWSLACKKSKSSSVQSSSACDLEDTCSSQSSSHSQAFTHFFSCSHCSLMVVRGSTNSPSSGSPDPVSILCLSSSPMSGCSPGLLFNILCRFVIAFLPRNKYLLISWLQSSWFWSPRK